MMINQLKLSPQWASVWRSSKLINQCQLHEVSSAYRRFLHSSQCKTPSHVCSSSSVNSCTTSCLLSTEVSLSYDGSSAKSVSDYEMNHSNKKTDNLYYVENGFRKVYPYKYTFRANAKLPWVDRSIKSIFMEFFQATEEQIVMKCEIGNIRIQGRPVHPDYNFKMGDLLHHDIHFHEFPVLDRPIKIIHQNDEMLVVDKPCSIPVHPVGHYVQNTVTENLLKEHGISDARNVNRLDRLTSGILVLARNPESAKQLNSLLNSKDEVKKLYVARVVGKFPKGNTLVSKKIKQISYSNGYSEVHDDGKDSVTKFRRLFYDEKSNSSVVLCTLLTGRTHQIRVHLTYSKHPIVNDILYNPTEYIFEPKVFVPPHRGIRWEVDEICKFCASPLPDPNPKELEMYLHALCCSGSDWKYETDMPPWGNPTWEDS